MNGISGNEGDTLDNYILDIYLITIHLLAFAAFFGFICATQGDEDEIEKQLKDNDYDDDYIDTFLPQEVDIYK